MKKRDGKAEGSPGGGGGGGGGSESKKKRRLGGKGLSLEAFVGANKVKPVVTASQIRKQREAYQNSKKVNKYRKTLKHLAEEGHEFRPRVPLSVDAEISSEGLLSDPSGPGPHSNKETPTPSKEPSSEKGGRKPKKKKASQLERLREEYEKKRQEEEEIRREKRALFEEQQAAREKSKKERKEVQKKFRKTTGKGQPVMKHRMEHLLESIQRDMTS